MEYLQNLGILDSIKNACYLFFGLVIGYNFWEFCEKYAKRGIASVSPFFFLLMLVWGASGFFFLPYIQNPIAQLLYYAVPDWDIPLYVWTTWEFLQPRSWLFGSILVPLIFLGIVLLLPQLCKRRFNITYGLANFSLNCLRDLAIGLSIGISAHLLGDFLLQWIPTGDTDINIFAWNELYSLIWLGLNVVAGISIPFFLIRKLS